jgi:hypothetical protein
MERARHPLGRMSTRTSRGAERHLYYSSDIRPESGAAARLAGSLIGWFVCLRPASLVAETGGALPDPRAVEARSAWGQERPSGPGETDTFHEVQRPDRLLHLLRSLWLVIVLGVLSSTFLVDNTRGRLTPALIGALVPCLWGVLFGLLWGYFYFTRLVTRVTKDGVVVVLSFREGERILHAEIESARVQPYDPDAAGGRFAVRTRDRTAFWVAGGQSVERTLRDGRRVQIGTQLPRELLSAMETCVESVSSASAGLE